jgi:hypothetical protein
MDNAIYFSFLKVVDAPDLLDDFCLRLIDWSSQNVLNIRKLFGLPAQSKPQGCVICLEMASQETQLHGRSG